MRPMISLALVLSLASIAARAELFVSDFTNNVMLGYNETNGAFLDVLVPNTSGLLSRNGCCAQASRKRH
jgi:hypothetical protein